MSLFRRKPPHRCPALPEHTTVRTVLQVPAGGRLTLKAHRSGGVYPMGWVNVTCTDVDGHEPHELTVHFEEMIDYELCRYELRLPQLIDGVPEFQPEVDNGDHTRT